jgi:GT2 family glycosyltransferase
MMSAPDPVVFVAVPVWGGETMVEEMLRSLQAQTWGAWRATISVDGSDEASAERCRPFLADPRITMVVQPERLGWAANLNWLMARSDGDFFVYWQQDDLCATNYLETLVRYACLHPEAACVFADVQWFGARIERVQTPSVTGFALPRVLAQIESLSYLPFRGLIRRQALADTGPLNLATSTAAFADLGWGVHLARSGELHAVSGTLYYKRAHGDSLSHGHWPNWSTEQRRAAWLECAIDVLAAALPAVAPPEWPRLLEVVVERFALAKAGRGQPYDPAAEGPTAAGAFAVDLVEEAGRRLGIGLPPGGPLYDPAVERLLRWTEVRASVLNQVAATLESGGIIGCGDGDAGVWLLGPGWSTPEAWGTWSRATTAHIVLPPLAGEHAWRLHVDGTAYLDGLAAGASRRLLLTAGHETCAVSFAAGVTPPAVSIEVGPDHARRGVTLSFTFPDAVSPAALGLTADTRLLGFAVRSLRAEPVAPATLDQAGRR